MTQTYNSPSEALEALCDFFNGNKSEMGRAVGVARNTIGWWYRREQVGKLSAITIDKDPNIPFTKEQLRPDIEW